MKHQAWKGMALGFVFLSSVTPCIGVDMDIKLSTTDGSTKVSIQNSAVAEVASIDSQGNATFTKMTQTGPGLVGLPAGSVALTALANGTLQSGVVASSIAANSVYPAAVQSAAYPNVTGVGTQGQALNMNSNLINNVANPASATDAVNKQYVDTFSKGSTNYIQVTNALQSGATFYTSSGTVNHFTVGTSFNMNSNLINNVANPVSAMDAVNKQYVDTFAKGSTNYIQASSTLQSGATFYISSGTVSGSLTIGSLRMPAGASMTAGNVQGTLVPSGTLILTTATCPTGFTEYTAAGGFYLVGVPSGGTVGGTVGSAMTNLSNANHNHTVASATANFLGGVTPAVTSVTSPTGDVTRGTIAPYFQIRLCSVP